LRLRVDDKPGVLADITRILADQQFEIVYESPKWIRPEPYPSFAFPGWACDWTKDGLQQGPVVDLGD
ncbi:MAG: ACT domain-containing protein, partial [Pirellulaceae bacterium]